MRVAVCRPGELGPPELRRWEQLATGDRRLQHPFLSARFAVMVGAVRSDARVAVLEEKGQAVGFWPFSVDRFRVARAIAPGYCDREGMVHEPGLSWDWRRLLEKCGLSGWQFGDLGSDQAPASAATEAASLVIDLAQGWAPYLAEARAAHKKYFKQLRRRQERMEEEFKVSYTEEDPTGDGLAALMDLKSRQCRARGWRDVFAPEWIRELVRQVATTKGDDLAGLVPTLRLDGVVASAQLVLRSGTTQTAWFISFDPRFASFSPGAVACLHMVEAAGRAGVDRIDLGRGPERFKRYWGNEALGLAEGFLSVRGLRGGLSLVPRVPVAGRRLLQRYPQGERVVARAVRGLRRLG